MLRYKMVTPESPEWQAALARLNYDIYHLPQYVLLNAGLEGGEGCAFIAEEDDNLFFFPLIIRQIAADFCDKKNPILYDAISPYGYTCPLATEKSTADFYAKALQAFFEELRNRKVVSLFSRIHPILTNHAQLEGYGDLVYHGKTVSVDLTLSEREIGKGIRRNHLDNIKRAYKRGFAAVLDSGWEHFTDFITLYYETMDRNHASRYYYFSPEYFERLRGDLREHLHLAVVLYNGEVASAGIYSEVNGIVQYHLGGTADKFLRTGSSKILIHFMILWEKQRGNKLLHLGGGVGCEEDMLFHFKAGFSDVRHPFYTWRVIINQEEYARLTAEWEGYYGKKADKIQEFFPAYRKIAVY